MSERRKLTFSQREGYEEVPRPLQLEELPARARTKIWDVFYELSLLTKDPFLEIDVWLEIMEDVHREHDGKPLDEWVGLRDELRDDLKHRVGQDRFNHVFDLIEFIIGHKYCPSEFTTKMSMVFKSCRLAYAIVVIDSREISIMPATTREEGDELVRNVDELRHGGMEGAVAHLRNASQCINRGDWASSIRESIHAVESVARQIDPAASKTLRGALGSLKTKGVLKHGALIEALNKLYGYTLDEQGIRHALLEKAEADVTVDEAVFFLGACASFASYLWRKHQAAAPS